VTQTTQKQAEILGRLAELRVNLAPDKTVSVPYTGIMLALEQFSECVRYLNTRRNRGAKLSPESEADVQDAIYLMLRPWVHDLVWESPTEKVGNRFSIRDFVSKSARTVIEAKYIRDEDHGKRVSQELHDDIEVYRHNPYCDHLIFFIYDPDSNIPDVEALRRTIEEKRAYGERVLYCHLIVKP
jgi:hypothetical protein